MTDSKPTCVACKSAITEGDIAHNDLEFGGELKATNQPEYTADEDTDLVATVGTLDEYTHMVRTTGNQTISGIKSFSDQIRRMSEDWSYIELKATKVDRHTLPSTNIRMGGIAFQDANGEGVVSLAVDLLTDGHISVILEGVDSNDQYWNTVLLNRQVIF